MKYRVEATDGTQRDFDTEPEARVLFVQKKVIVSNAKVEIKGGVEIVPSASVHRCYHDEKVNRPCEMIEKFVKPVSLGVRDVT